MDRRAGGPVSKTASMHWFDLEGRRLTRRDFARVSASLGALLALGSASGCGGRRMRFAHYPFPLGVASGDPSPSGVVLWTRLGEDAIGEAGAIETPVSVGWEIAEDEGFGRIAASGRSDARPELGHSVHVEAEGLLPGRDYFYRFHAGGHVSPVARTKTAPAFGADLTRFDFAFASCQHYEHGYYTALRHLSEESVDLIVHLGDYIYETRAAEERPRSHGSTECTDLAGYRARYALYKRDPDLQAAHHAAPWVVTTDDHEVDNNYADLVPEDDQSPEAFALRRAAAYQAFYEFMPVRSRSAPTGPNMPLYRTLDFGSLVQFRVLDTRQYRDDQPCGDRIKPSCPEHLELGRSILGAEQRSWLLDGWKESSARWNVMAQQVLFARSRRIGDDGAELWSMDKWDGYPLERGQLLSAMADPGVANPIVLTGDIHSSWASGLLRDFDDAHSPLVGTEFACTSLSSGGNGVPQSPFGAAVLPENPHFEYYNSQRGYVHVSVTPELWSSTYRIVPEVERPGGGVETGAAFVVENGRPGAQRV